MKLNGSLVRAGSEPNSSRALCSDITSWALDVDAMAPQAAVGAWTRMTAAQRRAYSDMLRDRLTGECASRARIAVGKPAEIVGVRRADDGVVSVATRTSGELLATPMIWRGRIDESGEFRAIDIVVDGRSALADARAETRAALDKNGGDVEAMLRSVRR